MWPKVFGHRMKVFLSHSTKDKQFVQTLAAELEAEKIEPWLCEIDIEFGQNFVAKIEEGLRDADLTVLFWSPDVELYLNRRQDVNSSRRRSIGKKRHLRKRGLNSWTNCT